MLNVSKNNVSTGVFTITTAAGQVYLRACEITGGGFGMSVKCSSKTPTPHAPIPPQIKFLAKQEHFALWDWRTFELVFTMSEVCLRVKTWVQGQKVGLGQHQGQGQVFIQVFSCGVRYWRMDYVYGGPKMCRVRVNLTLTRMCVCVCDRERNFKTLLCLANCSYVSFNMSNDLKLHLYLLYFIAHGMKKPSLLSLCAHLYNRHPPTPSPLHKTRTTQLLGVSDRPTDLEREEATKAPDIRRHRKPTQPCHCAVSLSLL